MSKNKEKGIIIDQGVEYYNMRCSYNPECYYKQLQREKQKNKKTEKTLKRIEEIAEDRSLYCEDCAREIITCEDCGYIKILSKIKEVEND